MVNKIKQDEKYITTSEAAKILRISRIAVFKKIKRGELPARKIGRNYIIEKKALSPAFRRKISDADKKFISDTTSKVVEEYGEALELLGQDRNKWRK